MAGATSRICQLAQPKRKQVLEESIHKSEFVKVIPLPSKTSALTELLASKHVFHYAKFTCFLLFHFLNLALFCLLLYTITFVFL